MLDNIDKYIFSLSIRFENGWYIVKIHPKFEYGFGDKHIIEQALPKHIGREAFEHYKDNDLGVWIFSDSYTALEIGSKYLDESNGFLDFYHKLQMKPEVEEFIRIINENNKA